MRKPGSGSKTGKLTPERVAEFKRDMQTRPVTELHREKYKEVSIWALRQIAQGLTWINIQPASQKG